MLVSPLVLVIFWYSIMTSQAKRVAGFVAGAGGCGPASKAQKITHQQTSTTRLLSSATKEGGSNNKKGTVGEPPLYIQEGLFAVNKPLGWTSQQVVGKIRWILEQDAKERGVPDNRTKRRKPWMKIGHGGTLDPLATGVLVVGVGKGTKQLQNYLTGSKGYRAGVELGFQTTTLDMDPKGEIVDKKPYDHVTKEVIEIALPQFRGSIMQTPPIFSALKRDGKKLYELGRKGKTEEDVKIEPRKIQIYRLDLLSTEEDNDNDNSKKSGETSKDESKSLPTIKKFEIDVECGGGTYIRSLVRDIGIAVNTVATMVSLERTKQGIFQPEHCLKDDEKDWTPDNIYKAISDGQELLAEFESSKKETSSENKEEEARK